jgi:hypothetical protein
VSRRARARARDERAVDVLLASGAMEERRREREARAAVAPFVNISTRINMSRPKMRDTNNIDMSDQSRQNA